MGKTADIGRVTGTKDGAIATLMFENPARLNALSPDMAEEALDVLSDFAADPGVRVLIMRGQGEKAFISGGDISKFEGSRFDPQTAASSARSTELLFERLAEFPVPVIAMIHGYCLGGGMGVALSADLRFGSQASQLSIPAALRGMAYPPTALDRLVALVGPGIAKDIMFSGRRVGAEEASRLGLLNRVFPVEALEAETLAYAKLLVGNAPLSIAASKFCINESLKAWPDRDHRRIEELRHAAISSADFREATIAFMEKRKPEFTGR